MIGAVIGDILGSRYEGLPATQIYVPENLWDGMCSYTDDTVLTAAVARWLLDGGDLSSHLHELGNHHLRRGYGESFLTWLLTDPIPPAYGSFGNGAAMRVSPVALWAQDDVELLDLAAKSALPTHTHPQGIRGAQVAAWAMCLARQGLTPDQWAQAIEARFHYPIEAFDADSVRRRGMELECETTVLSALWCARQGGSFQGTIEHVFSLGGDTDTVAAIAGPMAEGLYGLPPGWVEKAAGYFLSGDGVWETFQRFYAHPRVQANLNLLGQPIPVLPVLPPLNAPAARAEAVKADPFTRFFQTRAPRAQPRP